MMSIKLSTLSNNYTCFFFRRWCRKRKINQSSYKVVVYCKEFTVTYPFCSERAVSCGYVLNASSKMSTNFDNSLLFEGLDSIDFKSAIFDNNEDLMLRHSIIRIALWCHHSETPEGKSYQWIGCYFLSECIQACGEILRENLVMQSKSSLIHCPHWSCFPCGVTGQGRATRMHAKWIKSNFDIYVVYQIISNGSMSLC